MHAKLLQGCSAECVSANMSGLDRYNHLLCTCQSTREQPMCSGHKSVPVLVRPMRSAFGSSEPTRCSVPFCKGEFSTTVSSPIDAREPVDSWLADWSCLLTSTEYTPPATKTQFEGAHAPQQISKSYVFQNMYAIPCQERCPSGNFCI